jgi:serine/threonine protein kinase
MSSLEVGTRIGERYVILPDPRDEDEVVVGQGTFGIIYHGRDERFGDLVAIKEYFPSEHAPRRARDGSISVGAKMRAGFEKGLEELRQEALTLRRFHHRNIVRVLDYVEDFGTAYIIMEWIPGETLAEQIGQGGRRLLTIDELRPLLVEILGALDALHDAAPQVLHRDIKPSNIMIRDGAGAPVLIDFGAARQITAAASQRLTAILTAGYAPYEQYVIADEDFEEAYGDLAGAEVSSFPRQGPPTDLYALGAVCHFALTGMKPRDSLRRKFERLPYKPLAQRMEASVSDLAFLQTIDKALAVEPGGRFASARQWLAALERDTPVEPEQAKRDTGNARGLLILGAVVAGLFLLVVVIAAIAASNGSSNVSASNNAAGYAVEEPVTEPAQNSPQPIGAADNGVDGDPMNEANSAGNAAYPVPSSPPERIASAIQGNGVRNSTGAGDRYLIVQNLCSRPITLILNWTSSGTYQRTTNGWDILGNSSRILRVNNYEIFPDSSTIFYSVYHPGDSPPTSTDGNRVYFNDGSSMSGWRGELSIGQEGHYMLIFCQINHRSLRDR